MYKHFIFDIDGTLIDTERTGVMSLIKTIKELLGVEMPYDEAYKYFGIPSSNVAPLLDYPETERFAQRWEENFIELSYMMKAFDGVEDILLQLKESGKYVGCVTSRNKFEFNKDIHLQKLVPYFDYIICAEDTKKHKPDPEPVLEYFLRHEAATGESVLPGESVYVGDTMHDFECGHGAGCDFILADWRDRGFGDIPAKGRFTSASELSAILGLAAY